MCVYAGVFYVYIYISINIKSTPPMPRIISPQRVFAGAVNKKDECDNRSCVVRRYTY